MNTGDVLDVSNETARDLMRAGYAEEVREQKSPRKADTK